MYAWRHICGFDLSLNFVFCIRENKTTDKNDWNFVQTSTTEHFPNSLFHGKDHYKDFRDNVEPVFLKEIKEWARKLSVDTQKDMHPFKGKKNSNFLLCCKILFNLDGSKTSKSPSSEYIISQLPLKVAKYLITYFRSEVWVQLRAVEPQVSQYLWPTAIHHHFHVWPPPSMLYNHYIFVCTQYIH